MTALVFFALLSVPVHSRPVCDQSLWRYVYKPQRLQVLQECATVSGVIAQRRKEKDGDWHIQLKIDPRYDPAVFLNAANVRAQSGNLVVEIICQGRTAQASAADGCAAYKAAGKPVFDVPAVGARIVVTGALVLDKQSRHGWKEIHPVSTVSAR